MTALEMNRVIDPSFSKPRLNWKMPTITARVTIAGRIMSSEMPLSELPTTIINALVGAICMNSELVKSAPTGVPTMMALKA